MSGDLFAPATGPAPSRRSDPDTSHRAGEKIGPAVPSIRAQVESFAMDRGPYGFIDDDLEAAFPGAPESSYRKRRSELSQENIIVDSGKRRKNGHDNPEIVWIHRSFAMQPEPVAKREPAGSRAAALQEGREMVRNLRQWAASMRKEGRTMFAQGLEDAARVMDALLRA